MQFFEVLSACYETLMNGEFRRRCDVLLKEAEKKQNSKTNQMAARTVYKSASMFSEDSQNCLHQRLRRSLQSGALTANDSMAIKGMDSIPGLIPSSSQSSSASGNGQSTRQFSGSSAQSNETLPRNNCTSIGGLFACAVGSGAIVGTSSKGDSFTISRDGTKGFKSLVDSSSMSASHSTEEEAEIHFSEATVNRLFGGPLAALHRARNFQTFSDPYVVFDKVFGNRTPIFPRVTIADIRKEEYTDGENNSNAVPIRSPMSQFRPPELQPLSSPRKKIFKKKIGSPGRNESKDQTIDTKVIVSSRVVNGRKITKTETVQIDSATGIASVTVTVDGEYLQPAKSNKKSLPLYGGGVADWLLCFGAAKVAPGGSSRTATTRSLKNAASSPKQSGWCTKDACPSEDNTISTSCQDLKALYAEVLDEFYFTNNKFYEEVNRYMSCGT